MNFLAHIFLSGNSTEVLIGNFIGDFVKGKKYQDYPEKVSQGILLHRRIDSFTDRHPIAKHSAKLLRPDFGKYSAVLVDIFYDHFLAINFQHYSAVSLEDFSKEFYNILLTNQSMLPKKVQEFLPNMIENNWLARYANLNGIERTLLSLDRRTAYHTNLQGALLNLQEDYEKFQEDFEEFFPLVQDFASDQLKD